MIDNKKFFDSLVLNGVEFFTGVPDSLLKNICAYVTDHSDDDQHIITANEGNAVALATGYHLATGKLPLVYFQNSGLGNIINPLVSLADEEVYQIPMILMIGWRGEPDVKDEPQHQKQGRVQNQLLDTMEVPYRTLHSGISDIYGFVTDVVDLAKQRNTPVAIIVKKGTFKQYQLQNEDKSIFELTRERAIELVLDSLHGDPIIVSTTGKTSREVFEYRERHEQGHRNDFLTVGSMGHTSQIALGVALKTDRKVICLDGDGSVIMHMGALAINGSYAPENFIHLVINNGAHDSVGGQPTVGFQINIPKIAEGCGYRYVKSVNQETELVRVFEEILSKKGPSLLEVKVRKGARPDLGRPTTTPVENKKALMNLLS